MLHGPEARLEAHPEAHKKRLLAPHFTSLLRMLVLPRRSLVLNGSTHYEKGLDCRIGAMQLNKYMEFLKISGQQLCLGSICTAGLVLLSNPLWCNGR